eukprot:1846079-Prorocentrum_lima.AAC.1
MAAARTRRSSFIGTAPDAEIAIPMTGIPRIASWSLCLPRRQPRRPRRGKPRMTSTRSTLDADQ